MWTVNERSEKSIKIHLVLHGVLHALALGRNTFVHLNSSHDYSSYYLAQ